MQFYLRVCSREPGTEQNDILFLCLTLASNLLLVLEFQTACSAAAVHPPEQQQPVSEG